jgi:DNA repair exonuclease SbcCD nuclease subunit
MKILVFADLHYYGDDMENFHSERKLVQFALPVLDELIKIAAREEVDLVVNLGDIIQDTSSKELDIESLAFMFRRLEEFPCPCYNLLGNHDLKRVDSAEEIRCLMGEEAARYSIDVGGFHLVFLTTDVMPELGTGRGGSYKTQNLSEESLERLKTDLKNNRLPCLLFTHFPLAEDKDVQDECAYMKNRDAVKEILRNDPNIKAVFSGHQHAPKVLEEDGITHYIVGSPTTCFTGDGIPIGVYRMIETDGEHISITEHHIVL